MVIYTYTKTTTHMIKHFINFEWKQFFRSSYWQKSIALNILMAFLALYFILVFLALGIGLYPILKKKISRIRPLNYFERIFVLLVLGRFANAFFLTKITGYEYKTVVDFTLITE